MTRDSSDESSRTAHSIGGALREVLSRLERLEQQSSRLPPSAATELTAAIERLRVELAQEQRGWLPIPTTAQHEATSVVLERLAAHAPRESRYRLDGEIARGGMGAILQAWDTDLRRTLAMKVALGRSDGERVDGATLARFFEEAQVTGQLDHPGVVPVHELGIDGAGRVYFTMRLVRGRDLARIFELARTGEEGWSQTRVLGVLLKVCEAMAYAHDKGVIHRDLKPANVMVGRFGEVYVMDWGLAKVTGDSVGHDLRPDAVDKSKASQPERTEQHNERIASETPLLTMDGTVLGTPAYMSPEQARGEVERMDVRSDVYAVGAMLYQLLTGRTPYQSEERKLDARALLTRVLEGPPAAVRQLAADAPAELVAVCERAMARERDARYSNMLALADDLRAWLEGRVVRAYESGAWPELKKWVRRNRALAASSAAAVLAIVAGALWSSHVEARGREDLRLTADAYVPAYLVEEAEQFSPADPVAEARMLAWLSVARDLITREHVHRERVERGEERLSTSDAVARVDHERSRRLLEQLTRLTQADSGLIAAVETNLERAREIRRRSHDAPEAVRAWDEAITAIADATRSPPYDGLRITPQFGLLPIGPDPASGLWEFAHLPTGEPPARDASTGQLAIDGASCVVLVLLPGGKFTMGEQHGDAAGPRYFDEPGKPDNAPPVEVELAPFFISKYEFTQAQWERTTGANPSKYDELGLPTVGAEPATNAPVHPVEQVSWLDCTSVADKLRLVVPTEAQWEFAARGGTTTTWWTGDDRSSLVGAGNIADQTLAKAGENELGELAVKDWPEFDDGFAAHAPVDRFRPNPFGLCGTVGNVWEWCRDKFGALDQPARAGDGLREGRDPREAALRGGSFEGRASSARCANRGNAPLQQLHYVIGFRPARQIDP